MKILICTPEGSKYTAEIDGTLESMHQVVGGYIEPLTIGSGLVLICDEEGKLNHKLPSMILVDRESFHTLDVIVGTFFICAEEGENLISLGNHQLTLADAKVQRNSVADNPPFVMFL